MYHPADPEREVRLDDYVRGFASRVTTVGDVLTAEGVLKMNLQVKIYNLSQSEDFEAGLYLGVTMNGDADEEIEPDASGTFFPIHEDWLIPTTQSSVPEDPRAPSSRKRSGPYLLSDEVHKMRYAFISQS